MFSVHYANMAADVRGIRDLGVPAAKLATVCLSAKGPGGRADYRSFFMIPST